MNTLFGAQKIQKLVAENYSLGKVRDCRLIRRGFNDHYILVAEEGKYIFRVYLNNKYYIESHEDFQFELELIEHLHNQNIPVAKAIRLNSGELMGSVSTEFGERAFALFSFAEGSVVEFGDISLEQCFEFGKTVAAFHHSANNFQTNLNRYRFDLKYLVDEPLRFIAERNDNQDSESVSEDDKKYNDYIEETVAGLQPIETLVDTVKNINIDNDEFGIIHGDLHFGNMHFQNNDVTLFDFDHCGYGWRVYDITIAFYLPEDKHEAVLKGYESIRPLSESEKAALPALARLRMLWDIGDSLATTSLRAEPTE